MTIEQFIETYNPCQEAAQWLRYNKFKDMAQAWKKCERGDWMMWTLRKIKYGDKKTLVLLACDFAEHVLPQYEKIFKNDSRPRDAIQVARDVVNEKKSAHAADAAANAAYAAYAAAAYAAAHAADAAAHAADAAAHAAHAADAAAAYAAAYAAAHAADERKWQAKQIRKYIKDPFAGQV